MAELEWEPRSTPGFVSRYFVIISFHPQPELRRDETLRRLSKCEEGDEFVEVEQT